MRKSLSSLAAVVVMAALALVGLVVTSSPASANTCFRTVSVTGQNAYGYGKAYSWQSPSKLVRTAPAATLCIKYGLAYGGYYISYVTCTQSSARLTGDSTYLVSRSNTVAAAYWTYASCRTSATWKWDRTVANDQCADLWAQSRWNINQSNGTVTHASTSAQDDDFVPAYC
jgi:uncharacterized membrane protein